MPERKKTLTSPPPPSSSNLSNTNRDLASGDLSPEQLSRMEKKKNEAEARLLAKKLGAGAIGPSWMQVLHAEFKKDYMEKVHHYLLLVIQ